MMTLLPRKRYLSQKEFEGEETNRKKKQTKKQKQTPNKKPEEKLKNQLHNGRAIIVP